MSERTSVPDAATVHHGGLAHITEALHDDALVTAVALAMLEPQVSSAPTMRDRAKAFIRHLGYSNYAITSTRAGLSNTQGDGCNRQKGT